MSIFFQRNNYFLKEIILSALFVPDVFRSCCIFSSTDSSDSTLVDLVSSISVACVSLSLPVISVMIIFYILEEAIERKFIEMF